ncbi:hypothetical protein Tco_0156309, partial [Tanacetum coccineum]
DDGDDSDGNDDDDDNDGDDDDDNDGDDDDDDGDDDDDNDGDDDDDDNDDNNDDDSDHERTESDRDENPNLNQFNEEHEEEEEKEENVDEFTNKEDDVNNAKDENEEELDDGEELYKDVNVYLRKEDVKMTDTDQSGADQHNVSQESGFEQEEEDAHVTLTVVHDTQQTEGPMQSSSVSSDFTEKLLNFENVSPADNEIASLMDTIVRQEEPSGHTSTLFTVPITTIPPTPHFFNPLPQQTTPTPTPTTSEATTSFPTLPDFSSVFKFNDRVTKLETDLSKMKQVDQYAQAISSIPVIVDRYINNKLGEPIYKAIQSHNAECREEDQAKKHEYIDLIDTSSSQPKSTYEAAASLSKYELAKILLDKMEEIKSHLRVDYKRKLYDALLMDTPIDFSAFVMNRLNITNLTQELLVGPAFNLLKGTCKSFSELEYHFEECSKATTERLDCHNPKGKPQYSTSVTKTKAATYEIKWIEYMVSNLWSPVKIEVRREDQQLYTFKEGNFPRLRLQDIEDMLLLLVQQKLTNLTIDERYDLNVALRMFTRRIVIQRRVEDLQLGVESYQKKLNLTKPNTFRQDLRNRTAYTAYSDPHGVIYVDQNNRNRLMCTDEFYKFSDGKLDSVRTTLHDITSGIRMEYLPKKKWSRLDKRRARVMIHNINKLLFERRLMRNLEKFVGGREYRNDLRLLERTT